MVREITVTISPPPAQTDARLDEAVDRRARECLDKGVDHDLAQQLDRAIRMRGGDLKDDVVQPSDRAAVDPPVEPARVDRGQRQRRGIGAPTVLLTSARVGVSVIPLREGMTLTPANQVS